MAICAAGALLRYSSHRRLIHQWTSLCLLISTPGREAPTGLTLGIQTTQMGLDTDKAMPPRLHCPSDVGPSWAPSRW